MTRDEIVEIVLSRCGQRQADAALRAQLLTECAFIQTTLEGGVRVGQADQNIFLPWFLIKESTTLTQSVGSETVALPDDFLMEFDEEIGPTFWYYSSGASDPWIALTKKGVQLLRKDYPGTGDAPRGYDILGSLIYVRPVANIATTYRMLYYGTQPVLTDTVKTNAWTTQAADVMLNELIVAGARLTRDANLLTLGMSESKLARERLHTFHVARAEAARERFMGEAR